MLFENLSNATRFFSSEHGKNYIFSLEEKISLSQNLKSVQFFAVGGVLLSIQRKETSLSAKKLKRRKKV